MKTWTILLLVGLVVLPVAGVSATSVNYSYSTGSEIRDASDFYQPLASSGYWVWYEPYGWCWIPGQVNADWRPYTSGYWLWSEGGWYWVSEEPWAWATYHYGRWIWTSYYGWVWTPGTEWAPSWVCWREGGGYTGWAPLPPGCDFDPYSGVLGCGSVVVAPNAFVFVDNRHFCDPIQPSILVINQTFVQNTVNITHITRENHTVVNHGPDPGRIRRVSTHPLRVASIPAPRHDRQPPATQPAPTVRSPRYEPAPRPRHDQVGQTPRAVRIVRGPERESTPAAAAVNPASPERVVAPMPQPPTERGNRGQRRQDRSPQPVPTAPVVLADQTETAQPVGVDPGAGRRNGPDRRSVVVGNSATRRFSD